MPRAFISIEINEEIRRKLVETQMELKKTMGDIKFVEPPNIHVTLRFLGDVSERKISEVIGAIVNIKKVDPYDLLVKGLGVFPHFGYIRVIWAGIEDGLEKTKALRRDLDENLALINFPLGDREYIPHITIGRVRSGKAKGKIAEMVKKLSDKKFGTSRVDAIELKKSKLTKKGPIYSTIKRLELG